jgi:hypothetical protein
LIDIWKDLILGSPTLGSDLSFDGLKHWMMEHQKRNMFDISFWSSNGDWSGWSIEDYPPPLSNQVHAFFQALKGANPIHIQVQYSQGWGVKGYLVKEGYQELLLHTSLLPKSSWWSNIWSTDGIPKIIMFCWIITHGNTLTE